MVPDSIKKSTARVYVDGISRCCENIYESIDIRRLNPLRVKPQQLDALDEMIRSFKAFLIENDLVEDE